MSVYIKNFEFPTTCCHCKLMVYNPELVWDDAGTERTGAWVCLLTGELIDNTKREEHCPLISVPDHGRLIDGGELYDKADAILTQILGYRDWEDVRSQSFQSGAYYSLQKVKGVISNAHTIIPASKEDK